MSEIRQAAMNSYKYGGLSYDGLNEVAKQFDNFTEDKLKRELQQIELMCCNYSAESVTYRNIAMKLYEVVCERHGLNIKNNLQ